MTARSLATTGAGVLALLLTTGCAQGSAEKAVGNAEAAIAAIRVEAEKIAPAALATLNDSLTAMKTRMEAGDYSGALMGARTVTTMARDLGANLETRKAQLTTAYETTAAAIPGRLEAVNARIAELAAMRRLPPTVNAAAFTAVRDEAPQWSTTWASITADHAAGNLAGALTAANTLRDRLAQAATALGMN